MSFDYKAEKPLLNSSFTHTSSSLQQKSRSPDNSPQKNSNNKLLSPNLESRQKLTQYGHNLSNIAVSYDRGSIQTKLTIGQPGDKYEREADRVSDRVMNMSQPVQRQENETEQMQLKPSLQRQETGEEEEAQMKPLANAITPLVQREAAPEEEEEAQMKPEIQRQEKEEEEEVQTKSAANGSTANTAGLEEQLNDSKGGGEPLSEEAQGFMEPRFGADFSNVRVHTDTNAVEMNQGIQAQAFTHGQDIYFNSGKYSPDTNEGKSLLAHELTHVVQQGGGQQRDDKSV